MSYTYSTLKTALAAELVVVETDPDFVAIFPTIIDQAEQRCYRDLDLLSTVIRDAATVTPNSRNFTLPQNLGRFVVTNGINIFTPAASTTTRNQVIPASRDYIDAVWPSETAASATTIPTNYAMITDQTVIFGPPPGASFTAEVIGTIRPMPLSASNTTTYLTLYLSDMFFNASMVAGSAWQKNFGAQADDPKTAMAWETAYQTAKASANVEEQRKRYAGGAWGSLSPTPIATLNR